MVYPLDGHLHVHSIVCLTLGTLGRSILLPFIRLRICLTLGTLDSNRKVCTHKDNKARVRIFPGLKVLGFVVFSFTSVLQSLQKSGQSPDPFPGSGGVNHIWQWHAIADVASCSCFPSAAAPARSLCPFQRGIVSLGCSHAPTYTYITLRSDWISMCSAVFSDDGSMLVHMSFHPSWPATTGHLAKV